MTTIRIPSPLRPHTQELKEIVVQQNSITGAMTQLVDEYLDLRTH